MIKKGSEVIIVFPATISYRLGTFTGERQDSISIKKLVCILFPDGKRFAADEQSVYPSTSYNKACIAFVDRKREEAQRAKSEAMSSLSSLVKTMKKCSGCGFEYQVSEDLIEERPYGHNRGYKEWKCPKCKKVLDTLDSSD